MIVSRYLPTQTSYSSKFVSKITYSRCHQLRLRKYLGPIWHKICSYTVFPQFRQADVRISWRHSQNHRIDVQCNQRVCARVYPLFCDNSIVHKKAVGTSLYIIAIVVECNWHYDCRVAISYQLLGKMMSLLDSFRKDEKFAYYLN